MARVRICPRMLTTVIAAAVVTALSVAVPVTARAAVSNLSPHGGPVQHHPKVFLLFWGPKWTTDPAHEADEAALHTMFSELAGTSYNNILTQYYDSSGPVANDVTLAGVGIDPNVPTSGLRMYDIAHEAWDRVHQSTQFPCLPNAGCSTWLDGYNKWGGDVQVMVIPQQGSNYTTDIINNGIDSLAGSTLCGNHDNTNDSFWTALAYGINANFAFSVVKYGSDSPCTASLGNASDPAGAGLTFTAAHEYAETVTDPSANGWYASSAASGEIGDQCENASAQPIKELGNNYVTQLWDNSTGGCQTSLGYDSTQLLCGLPMHTVDLDFDALLSENQSALGCPLSEKYAISGGFAQDFTKAKIYSNGTALPDCGDGRFSSGSIDQGIAGAYNAAGGIRNLGCPFDNGGGVFVHSWNGMNVQDFSGGSFGPAIMADGPNGTYFVNNGFRTTYLGGAVSNCGAPTDLAHDYNGGTRQDFVNCYMTWTSSAGVKVFQNCPVGLFSNGSVDQPILNAYYADGGLSALGCPFDNGGGVYVHWWGGPQANVQDFNGGSLGPAVMTDGPDGAFFVNDAFRTSYISQGWSSFCGPATDNGHGYNSGTRQDFTGCYMTWTSSAGVQVFPSGCVSYGINQTGPGDCSGNFTAAEGSWSSGTPHGLFGRELWAWGTGTAAADHVVQYRFPNLNPGDGYQIQAYIPNDFATANAHYRIVDKTGSTNLNINQNPISNSWVTIGYGCPGNFSDGNNEIWVLLLNDGNSGLQIGADAIRVTDAGITC